jgi:hypothetical protein
MTTRLRTSNLEPDSNFEDQGVGELSVEEKYTEVKQLIAIGKGKGFLLYDEIYEVLPEEVTSLPEELDEIYIRFNDLGIDVIEDAEKPLQASTKGMVTIDGTIEEKEMDQPTCASSSRSPRSTRTAACSSSTSSRKATSA